MARPEKVRLGEILVKQTLWPEEQVRLALEEQKKTGRKLGRVFVDRGFVSEEALSRALARQLNVPFVSLRSFDLKPEAVLRLPEAQARRFRAIVLEDRGTACRVGMADPTDLFAYDELGRILKKEIELAVVAASALLAAVVCLYRRTGEI